MLVNIGNTHLSFGDYENDHAFILKGTIKTADFTHINCLPEADQYFVASVCPQKNELFPREKTYFLNAAKTFNIIHFATGVDSSTIGADRLANVLAMKTTFQHSALCIDIGTCITFEYLNCDGIFASGAILPGRQLNRKAMHNYTAQLPLIEMFNTPFNSLPINTIDAMRLGVDTGSIGSVKELISFFETQHGGKLNLIFTGGDAPFFYQAEVGINSKSRMYAPHLTFDGLHIFKLMTTSHHTK